MPGFINQLAGKWSPAINDALLNTQFNNPESPRGVQQLGNLFGSVLGRGSIQLGDQTGTVGINPMTGQFDLMGRNFGLGFQPGRDPMGQVRFQFGRSAGSIPDSELGTPRFGYGPGLEEQQEYKQSPAKAELEEQLSQYRKSNSYWYRP